MKSTDRATATAGEKLILAVFLAVCALYSLTPVHNGNFFWHLRNGEDILETGTIRTADPFTWTRCGETWLQQEWVAEVMFAVSWKTAGEAGPVIFKALVIVMAAFLVSMAAVRRGASIPAVVVTGLLWFALSHGRWIVRPHIISILMFSLYLYLMAGGTGGFLSTLAVFLPLQIIWTNAHAGFIMGWFLLGIPLLDSVLARRPRSALERGGILAAVVLSAGVHPNGFGSVTYITDFLSRPLFRETIREWWSPFHPMYHPGQEISTTAVLLVVLLAATWTLVLARRRKIGASRMLALAALSAASLLSSRNIDFLALAALAWVSPLLGRVRLRIPAILLAAAAAVPFLTGVPREFGPPRRPGVGVDWSIYPRRLTEFLRQNPELLQARVFNTNEISGYLQYVMGEDLPLYMDGRCHLFTENLYAEYLLLTYAGPEDAPRVMNVLDGRGIQLALYDWPRTDGSSAYILSASPDWEPVYWDSITVVYGRASWLEEAGFRGQVFTVVDPLSPLMLLETPYYLMPSSLREELVTAASSPMNYQPAIPPAAALLQTAGETPDTLPFVIRSDSMRSGLENALGGREPCIEDPRLRVIQSWALAGAGEYTAAMDAAVGSGDAMLLSCLAVLHEEGTSAAGAAVNRVPPLMVPPPAWAGYLSGEVSPGDSCVIEASALFVAGMRDRALDSVRTILDREMELQPWGLSVSGGLAALHGLDSLAVALGDSAVSMNTNPYTLLIMGKIEGITGDRRSAVETLSRSLSISPVYHEARIQRAGYLWMEGRLEEAMEDYRLLEELNYLTPAAESLLEWGEYLTRPLPAASKK
ncbi:MAG: hypothetical protein R6U39_04790 [Candidatus Aegiribacteria sp.]